MLQAGLPFDYFNRTMAAGANALGATTAAAGLEMDQRRLAHGMEMDRANLELQAQANELRAQEMGLRYPEATMGSTMAAGIGGGLAGWQIGSGIQNSAGGNYGLWGAGLGFVAGALSSGNYL